MATSRNFSEMLNEYLTNDLLKEEMVKSDWFLTNIEKDNNWKGGALVVPFRGAQASTLKFGGLTNSGEIGQSKYVRGSVTNQPEVWGSMIFNARDLMEHDKISEQNFLKLLPDEVEDFIRYMKMAVSLSFTNGDAFDVAAADGGADGTVIVSRVERFEIGMKVVVVSDAPLSVAGFVGAVNMETSDVTIVTQRFGATPVDLSAYLAADDTRFYFDGHETAANRLTALKSSLLSAANGGSAALYGQTKLAYPYLQAINVSGTGITSTNILSSLFTAFGTVRQKGRGNPTVAIMSHKRINHIRAVLEEAKQPYKRADQDKAGVYQWEEITVFSERGQITCVGIYEMDDDWIGIIDKRALKIHSNGFFKKHQQPDGNEYFTIRGSEGYQYIVDICFFGDMVLKAPSICGIIHSIPA